MMIPPAETQPTGGTAQDGDGLSPGPSVRDGASSEGFAAERTISPVRGRLAMSGRGRAFGMLGMASAAALLIMATWDRGDATPRSSGLEKAPARQVVKYEGPLSSPVLSNAVNDPNAPRLVPDGALSDADRMPALQSSRESAGAVSPVDPRRQLADAARRAPILAYSAGRGLPNALRELAEDERTAQASELDRLRAGGSVAQSRAQLLPDRNFLITAGSTLPCVLQTALDSSVPGYATCLVPRDVYSDNGGVVLMEKGTKVLGEYRGGLRQGQNRLFVLWTRAVTPSGVAVTLASPAADGLGRAGFEGQVDSFFWKRFGGALLLSIIDDAANVAAQSAGRGRFNTTTNMPSEAANTALQSSIGIPPRLRKGQGEEVSIFVAQDLNFADVYGLSLR